MSAGKSKTSERAYVPPYLQDLYTKVSEKGLEELPFTPYSGQMVAGLTPDQMKAMTTTGVYLTKVLVLILDNQ